MTPIDLDELESFAKNKMNGGLSLTSAEALELIALARATPQHSVTEQDERSEAITLLAALFDAWENGVDCYEEPETYSGFLGKALHLDDDVFKRCCELLNCANPPRRAQPPASTATREQPTLIQALETGNERESPNWFDIKASEVVMYTEEGYKVRKLYEHADSIRAASERQASVSEPHPITDAELRDPEYMRAYVEECSAGLGEVLAENKRLRAALTPHATMATAGYKLEAFKGADTKQWHVVVKHPFGTSWVKMSDPRDFKLAELIAAAPDAVATVLAEHAHRALYSDPGYADQVALSAIAAPPSNFIFVSGGMCEVRAERALRRAGFEDHGGEDWTPPLGEAPRFVEAERLHAALTGLLNRYVSLVESGDAGNWNAETEDVVIEARAALAANPPPKDQK